MTIVTPVEYPAIVPISITGFPLPGNPYTAINPAMYRDGQTFMKTLENILKWTTETLVPYLNDNNDSIVAAWDAEVTQLVTAVNDAIAAMESDNSTAIGALTDQINTAIANVTTIASGVQTSATAAATSATNAHTSEVNSATSANAANTSAGNAATSATQAATSAANARKAILWQPNTTYAAGDPAISPAGDPIVAKAGFTSGAAYDATKWNLAPGHAPQNLYGTYATRPAANSVAPGTLYYASDVLESYRSDGALWKVVGAGSEIGYAQTTGNTDTDGTTNAIDVPGLSITFIAGERPIKVIFQGALRNDTLQQYARGVIQIDGVDAAYAGGRTAVAGEYMESHAEVRRAFTPGSQHTAKIQVIAPLGGKTSLSGFATDPAFIQVVAV